MAQPLLEIGAWEIILKKTAYETVNIPWSKMVISYDF